MTTYYEYLRTRVGTLPGLDRARLEPLIQAERIALWQMLIVNPATDDRGRLEALAAFDEAATRMFYEVDARAASAATPLPGAGALHGPEQEWDRAPHGREAAGLAAGPPPRARSWRRDAGLVLIGMAVGFGAAYFGRDLVGGALRISGLGGGVLAVEGLLPSERSFKFVTSRPAQQTGTIDVQYGLGSPPGSACDVEVSNGAIVESVSFDAGCRTISFKFLPLETLLKTYNDLQGYMVFTATVTAAGQTWNGTASIYFSIDAAA